MAHSSLRFFDGDMHFPLPGLNVLLRTLRSEPAHRERFFNAVIGFRRRMETKWQETPLARVLTVQDEWTALLQQAQSIFGYEVGHVGHFVRSLMLTVSHFKLPISACVSHMLCFTSPSFLSLIFFSFFVCGLYFFVNGGSF